jgi:hypothetical protein
MRTRLARSDVLVVYLALVLIAAVMGGVRLHQSSEMPGLAAIELVLLALPWSLLLGVEPLSYLGWTAMVGILVGGLVLNGLLVRKLACFALPRVRSRETRGA